MTAAPSMINKSKLISQKYSFLGMVMVKGPRLALSIWSLAVFAFSTSEAAALSPLEDEDLFTSKEVGPAAVDNELEQNLG